MSLLTILSWNVNGIRAISKKGFLTWLHEMAPDILCLQETKADEAQLPAELAQPEGYYTFWNSAKSRKGYSGTALFSREKPLAVEYDLGLEAFDQEGRLIIARYPNFTLLNCYFPNGGRDKGRVPFKLSYCEAFLEKCEQLRALGEPVIFCGDVNTAHCEIDLAHPKTNQTNTGFLPEERAWLDQVVAAGYVDTFRQRNPDLAGQYSWWSMVTRARERNVGWRLDYFFISPELQEQVADAFILPEVMGSDHCPVGLKLNLLD